MVGKSVLLLVGALLCATSGEYTKLQCQGNRQVIVHMFEWRWSDIANECEAYLGPKGFCAVQVSPPMEHVQGSEWWVRYQPVSYLLESRSGTREQFIDMVSRCKAVGVNIYVDAVINHMTGVDRSGVGTGGSSYDGETEEFPDFSKENFHQPPCPVNSYLDPYNVRNCYLVGLTDLDGSQAYVQDVQAKYLNDLIDIGVEGFRLDAAKHMWPSDIAAIQAKVHDVQSGGRPYFVMEVIDQANSGEITVNEYYSLGQTTEFRYCIKVGEGVRNGFFSLPGAYDPGWGMSDYEHAFIFVDNHDNQRGHGGGGNILTHQDPEMYRWAVAFTLALDYGTKRIMSSYYFDNSDQGPPETAPGCGDKWVCEHRWKSIGQMVEFTNAVFGEPIEFRVAEHRTLGLSRGNKGFFAMGELSREFDTGLPDGEYCDIISECKQKISISGGKGFFQVYDTKEPVVAICQGCTGQNGGQVDTTSTTSQTTTTASVPTTTTMATTSSRPTTTTTSNEEQCCQKVTFKSSGDVLNHYPEALGIYELQSVDANGRAVYVHSTQLVSLYLHHTTDSEFNWSGWQFTKDLSDVFGFVSNEVEDKCPSGTKSEPWKYHLNGVWYEDNTVAVECEGGEGSTTSSTDGTTTSGGNEPTSTTTRPPNPEGYKRTIIFIEKQTSPGQDVFIVGGQADGTSPIDVKINAMPEIWESYNSWMVGDDQLDWDGPEEDQGLFNDYPAMGTAAAWTTDDPTEEFYYELNPGLGPNFWIVDMEVDCSQTTDGWFEFNTIYSIGGEDGEPAVNQAACTGEVGGNSAIIGSTNHMALCGYMNIFSYGKGDCQIDQLPAKRLL